MEPLSNVVGIDRRKMEQIVADMQKNEPNAEFKMYNWDGELSFSLLPIMLENNLFKEENWNWDKKYKPENLDYEEDWDIT